MAYQELFVTPVGETCEYDGKTYKVLARKQGRLRACLRARLAGGEAWCDIVENGRPLWSVVKEVDDA